MLGKRKSSMSRSRVARGHFTLMAARPIETTAALHDLKVRRQKIIFQLWRRKTRAVKWCLPPPLLTPSPELLPYKTLSAQYQIPQSLLVHTEHHETSESESEHQNDFLFSGVS